MDEPVSVFFGWTVLGFGALLGYATWKKVPGGALGLLKGALTTGKIPTGPQGTTVDANTPVTLTGQTDAAGNPLNTAGGVGTAPYGPVAAPNPTVQKAINFAMAQLGKPYQWGATGPNAFDCSGLVQAAYKAAGVNLTRTTYTQILQGAKVTGSPIPGDLIFPDAGHVMLALGNGQAIQAPHTGAVVDIVPVPSKLLAVRRIVSSAAVAGGGGPSEPYRMG